MESNTEQCRSVLTTIRAIVQRDNDKKEEILNSRGVVILSAHELEDPKKMTDTYKEVVERNSIVMDFLMDVKNDILRIKLAKERLDKTTSLYLNQVQQIDNFIKILNDIISIIKDEISKMDRIVRFYERNYNTYSY